MNAPTREYIYLGAQLLAKIEGGTTSYVHHDHLSARVTTSTAGAITAQSAHYPFGENWYDSTSGGPQKLKFTSYERDAESGNDYAIFRTHITRFGRFASPDPMQGFISDPMSLNRYAYVENDPINLVDPLGLRMESICFHAACGASNTIFVNGVPMDGNRARAMFETGFFIQFDFLPNLTQIVPRPSSGSNEVEIIVNTTTTYRWECKPPHEGGSHSPACEWVVTVDGLHAWVAVGSVGGQGGSRWVEEKKDQLNRMGALVAGFELLVHPIHNLIVGNMMIFSGAVVAGAGVVATGIMCSMGPAACVVGVGVGGTVVAGGGILIYQGVKWHKDQTIPSFRHLFSEPQAPQRDKRSRQ